MMNLGFANPKPDSTIFDRATLGRPFSLEEFIEKVSAKPSVLAPDAIPEWVQTEEIPSDKYYYGIGKSIESSDAADDDARLRFAQYVEVSVQSIATQQIAENKDRLEENYNYESLVSTNMNLRSVKITDRFMTPDSNYYSLIKYDKSDYHNLVTQEIQISLETDIRKQELAHQATEALSADSLRHKLMMDSLALGRKQAVIDSLDHILQMEESRQRQDQTRVDLIKKQYADFLKIKPRYQIIDVPSASTPESWVYASGRWNPEAGHIRQLKTGVSLWLITAETSVWAKRSILDQGEWSVKLEVLPKRGDVYPVSLALGYIEYIGKYSEGAHLDLRDIKSLQTISDLQRDEIASEENRNSSFLVVGTVGVPQINSHVSVYYDNRKISLASIWYPFLRNLGDAISVLNQVEYFTDDDYRNRFDDAFQWQLGLRLIAIPNRFATSVSYEDHEVWMLNFEFQY